MFVFKSEIILFTINPHVWAKGEAKLGLSFRAVQHYSKGILHSGCRQDEFESHEKETAIVVHLLQYSNNIIEAPAQRTFQ